MQELRFFTLRHVNQTLWVELANPPVNFLTIEICRELRRVIKAADRDDSVRVIVLTSGVSGRFIFHFSIPELVSVARNIHKQGLGWMGRHRPFAPLLRVLTGLSLAAMRHSSFAEALLLSLIRPLARSMPALNLLLQMNAAYFAIENSRKVTIAAINGSCNGGGTELSCCFDFRFMVGDQNYTIGQPEVLVGIVAGGGGTQRVSRLIGKAKALELMMMCDQWTAEQARQAGLITGHFPATRFDLEVQAVADRLSRRSAVALIETRGAISQGLDSSLSFGLAREMIATLRCCAEQGTREALADYAGILDRSILQRPDDPATLDDIVQQLDAPPMTRHFS